jgi:transposase InsO family protein
MVVFDGVSGFVFAPRGGWAVSDSLTTRMVEQAFMNAQQRRATAVSPLVHSDRGCQFASAAFREKLAAWDCSQSMSRRELLGQRGDGKLLRRLEE